MLASGNEGMFYDSTIYHNYMRAVVVVVYRSLTFQEYCLVNDSCNVLSPSRVRELRVVKAGQLL